MPYLNIKQTGIDSCHVSSIDTKDIETYEVKSTFFGNYKLTIFLKSGNKMVYKLGYWYQVQEFVDMINKAKEMEDNN